MAIADTSRAYRYERKFMVERLAPAEVQHFIKLHPSMFYQPYPPRYVNNFYLDSEMMESYYDNVHGSAKRRKMRVRWYGELFGQIQVPVLEYKIKNGVVGSKRSYRLPPMQINHGFTPAYFQSVIAQADLPAEIHHHLKTLKIVLLNRYYRYYFATHNQHYRITLDTTLSFQRVDQLINQFIHRQHNHHSFVVELKYGIEQDDDAYRVASYFPFRVDKSSKYVQGIERVYF